MYNERNSLTFRHKIYLRQADMLLKSMSQFVFLEMEKENKMSYWEKASQTKKSDENRRS